MSKLKDVANQAVKSGKRNAPVIFTMAGIGGFIFTVGLAIKATPKAVELQKEFKEETTNWEKVKAIAPVYIPTFVVGVSSIACVLAANKIYMNRLGTLAAAYTLTSKAYEDYKDSVLETIGEKKEKAVRENKAKKRLAQLEETEPMEEVEGKTLCVDLETGGYFWSSKLEIEKRVNELNARLLLENYISVAEFRDTLGNHNPCKYADRIGWHSDFGFIEVEYNSELTPMGRPCLTIEYDCHEGYDWKLY